jgi:hypothetical protein
MNDTSSIPNERALLLITTVSIALLSIAPCCRKLRGLGFFWSEYSRANYTSDYIKKNQDKVLVEIPEVFELANIAIAISDYGLNDRWRVHKKGAYYERVLEHFKPLRDHPLIAEPDLNRNFTYNFRDNSACYVFEGDKIVHGGLYPNMRHPDLFKKHLALVEEFARVSNFRKFYRDNLPYYQEQIRLYRQKVPIRKMWIWLEKRFPARHDCYKVVFSPLIGSSHETCSFENNGFSETIMFVSGPGESKDTSNKIEEGILSRVVFTEIDHNYVNRVTKQYINRMNRAFADLDVWNQQSGYRRPEYTFNEYMTWAVFVLYAYDNYEKQNFEIIVKRSAVDTMVHHRKFVRFKEFAERLLQLYLDREPGQSVPDLYPAIIEWAETQASKDFGGGWLSDDAWMIIGPFDNTDMIGFDAQYPPEQEIDFTKKYSGKAGKVKWFKPEHKRTGGFVNLASLMRPNEWAVAYATACVRSPDTRNAQLRIGSDDDVKVWLNGKSVLSKGVARYAAMDQDIVPVRLESGRNQILLKVCNRTGSWGFYMRITEAPGKPYDDLTIAPRNGEARLTE